MSIGLYMDHHVKVAIAEALRSRGVDVITAFEDGARQFNDTCLLERATELNRVLFSQDRDLLVIVNQWLRAERDFAGLVYAHQMKTPISQIINDLELIAKTLDPIDIRNQTLFLPL